MAELSRYTGLRTRLVERLVERRDALRSRVSPPGDLPYGMRPLSEREQYERHALPWQMTGLVERLTRLAELGPEEYERFEADMARLTRKYGPDPGGVSGVPNAAG